MRSKNLVLVLAALAMVVALAACTSAGRSAGDQGQAPQKKAVQEQPKKKETAEKREPAKKLTDEAKSKQVAPKKGTAKDAGSGKNLVEPPKKKRLKLTVPAMKRIKDDPIPTGLGTDETAFPRLCRRAPQVHGLPVEEDGQRLHCRTPHRVPWHEEQPGLLRPGGA